jgi:hypothetical protein
MFISNISSIVVPKMYQMLSGLGVKMEQKRQTDL